MVVETKDTQTASARTFEQFIGGAVGRGRDGRDVRAPEPGDRRARRDDPVGRRRRRAEGDRRGAGGVRRRHVVEGAGDAARAGAAQRSRRRSASELLPLAQLLSKEVGKPTNMAIAEVAMAADVYDYYAGLALDITGDAITNFAPDAVGLTVHEPVGVVGVITPWNFPVLLIIVEAGAGARRGLHDRRQAVGVHGRHDVRAGAHHQRGGRAGRRDERRHRAGQRRRRGTGGERRRSTRSPSPARPPSARRSCRRRRAT